MPAARLAIIDMARGVAVAMMFVYHLCFDLANFGYLHQNLYLDARWIAWRSVILSSFLLLAGISLALAWRAQQPWPAFWRRFLQIATAAMLVSIGSRLMFPESFIWFGVLHHLALASLLALPLRRRPLPALALGLALIAVGVFGHHAAFDQQPWQFVGLMSFKPRTEDYVPLLPWLGVVLIGIWAGHTLLDQQALRRARNWQTSGPLSRSLACAGRHSLLLYLLHQPIFIGLLLLAARFR